MRAQIVHAVQDYYDGPIEGFAEFEDAPHHFKCQFDDDADKYSGVYYLTPISADTLHLVIENSISRWRNIA